MLTWYIEQGELKAPLERVQIPSIREVVDPIRDHLEQKLSDFGIGEDLDVVFVIDEVGKLSVNIRGSPLSVNLARDIIGERDRIGQLLS